MTEPKVAVALQQKQGADLLTGSLFCCSFIIKSYCGYLFVGFTEKASYSHVLYHNVLMWNQPIHTVMSALPPVLRGSQVE